MEPQHADHVLDSLIRGAAAGDAAAWQELMSRFHHRLRRMVALRLDPRLQGRVDPSDVMQDAYIDANEKLPGYLERPEIPFFLWLRLVTGQRLSKLHRFHLGQQVRDVSREVSLFHGALPEASSSAMAAQLLGHEASPSSAAAAAELRDQMVAAVTQLDPLDREVLSLRHFEQLTSPEVAQVLGISVAAAAKRYLRALERLRDVCTLAPSEWN